MPLQSPITVAQSAVAIQTVLTNWVKPRGGVIHIMANQRHLWEELASIPSAMNVSPRVMVLYAGETLLRQDEPDCHRVERSWQIVLVRGHGYKDPLSGAAYENFPDSVETIRDIVRSMVGISDYESVPSVQYKGIKPIPSVLTTREANAFMDGYVLEFSTYNDIPQVTN